MFEKYDILSEIKLETKICSLYRAYATEQKKIKISRSNPNPNPKFNLDYNPNLINNCNFNPNFYDAKSNLVPREIYHPIFMWFCENESYYIHYKIQIYCVPTVGLRVGKCVGSVVGTAVETDVGSITCRYGDICM